MGWGVVRPRLVSKVEEGRGVDRAQRQSLGDRTQEALAA